GLLKLFSFFSSYQRPLMELVQVWERHGASTDELKRLIKIHERNKSSITSLFRELARLYDTFGAPPDLSRVTLEQEITNNYFIRKWMENLQPDFVSISPDAGLSVIEEKFNEHFEAA